MNGLVKRTVDDLAVRVVGTSSSPKAATALLGPRWGERCDAGPAEVELLFLPGEGRFSGRADCNILVVLEDTPKARRMDRKAHLVVADRPYPGVPAECGFKLEELDRALGTFG